MMGISHTIVKSIFGFSIYSGATRVTETSSISLFHFDCDFFFTTIFFFVVHSLAASSWEHHLLACITSTSTWVKRRARLQDDQNGEIRFSHRWSKGSIPRCQALPSHAFSRLTGKSILVSLSMTVLPTHPDPYGEKLDLIRMSCTRLRERYPHGHSSLWLSCVTSTTSYEERGRNFWHRNGQNELMHVRGRDRVSRGWSSCTRHVDTNGWKCGCPDENDRKKTEYSNSTTCWLELRYPGNLGFEGLLIHLILDIRPEGLRRGTRTRSGSITMVLGFYAVAGNEEDVVTGLLEELKRDFEGEEYTSTFRVTDSWWRIHCVGTSWRNDNTDGSNVNCGWSSLMLLQHGANVERGAMMGNDALMLASILGRSKNVAYWIRRVSGWNLEKRNATMASGVTALHLSVFMGARKFGTTDLLLKAGASVVAHNAGGERILHMATENEDSDPDVIRLIWELKQDSALNMRSRARAFSWALIPLAKFLHRTRASKSALSDTLR